MPKRNTDVSAFVLRRNASCDMNYMYMCNSNSAAHIDVTELKKHDQVTHLGLGICVVATTEATRNKTEEA